MGEAYKSSNWVGKKWEVYKKVPAYCSKYLCSALQSHVHYSPMFSGTCCHISVHNLVALIQLTFFPSGIGSEVHLLRPGALDRNLET